MKTNELIDKIGKEKLLIYKDEKTEEVQYIRVFTKKVLSCKSKYVAEIGCVGQWLILRKDCPKELATILMDYNYTQLEERKEQKKYIPNLNGDIFALMEINKKTITEKELGEYNGLEKIGDSWYLKLTIKEEVNAK